MTEGYGPNPEAIEGLVKEGASSSSPSTAARPASTRSRRQRRSAPTCSSSITTRPTSGCRTSHAVVNPNRQDDLSGLGHLCAAGVIVHGAGGDRARAAQARPLQRQRAARTDLLELARSRGARDRVRRGAAEGPQSRLCHERAAGHARASQHRPAALAMRRPWPWRRRPIIWASCSGPRINAGGRIGDAALGARLLVAPRTRRKRRASPCCSTSSTASARRSRSRCWRRPSRMPISWWMQIPTCRCCSSAPTTGTRASSVSSRAAWSRAFQRPACVIAWDSPDEGTGSLRSIAGVDIGAAVRAARGGRPSPERRRARHGGRPHRGARPSRGPAQRFSCAPAGEHDRRARVGAWRSSSTAR